MNNDAVGVFGRILAVAAVLALPGLRDAVAAGPYDGTYHGTLTGGGMNALNCAKNAPIQMTVTDSQLEYHHFSNTVIRAPVAADGSFSGSAQNMYATRGTPQIQTLNGKISGPGIQADTKVGNSCTYTLTLKKF
jgi:hypothetical protein